MNYQGYTYPHIFDHRLVHAVWRRLFCPRGWHLWDECWSPEAHVLFCDACEAEFPPQVDK